MAAVLLALAWGTGAVPPVAAVRMFLFLAGVHLVFALALATCLDAEDLEASVAVFLVGLGLTSWFAFWAWFAHPRLGRAFTVLALLGLAAAAWRKRGDAAVRLRTAHGLLLPASAYAAFILAIGYWPLYQVDPALTLGANRWLALPADNILPKLFAEQLLRGGVQSPLMGDWLTSDRPPLQTGAYLLVSGRWPGAMAYQVFASWLQALVLLPAALLLRRTAPERAGVGLVCLGASSLLAVHVLFVWPKLLAAAYTVLAFLLAGSQGRSGPARGVLAGAAAGFAMLSHGGAVFALATIALVLLAARPRQALGIALPAILAAGLVYLPWLGYQRLVDPPGDRLLKWHLAGMVEPNPLSLGEALARAYGTLSWQEWLASRALNLEHLFGGTGAFWADLGKAAGLAGAQARASALEHVRVASFFELAYSLWAWSLPSVAVAWLVLAGWRRRWPSSATWLLATGAGSGVLAAVLLLSPEGSVLHQISLFSWIALFACGWALLSQLPSFVLWTAVALNLGLFACAYVFGGHPSWQQGPGTRYLLLAGAGFGIYALACLRMPSSAPVAISPKPAISSPGQ